MFCSGVLFRCSVNSVRCSVNSVRCSGLFCSVFCLMLSAGSCFVRCSVRSHLLQGVFHLAFCSARRVLFGVLFGHAFAAVVLFVFGVR